MNESIVVALVKSFGWFVRILPQPAASGLGKMIGKTAYYLDKKHKEQVYANLRVAFAETKTPAEIKKIARKVFENFGQNIIDLFRLPLINKQNYFGQVQIEGADHLSAAREKGNGVIILAMHYGSWELASLSCAMLDLPYKVLVREQSRSKKLNDLLNSYRSCNGTVVLSRGLNTRDMVSSLKNNEIIGMVVDQGGRAGTLVPFFGRKASFSAGAIRLALKRDVPICFAAISRHHNGKHKLVYHPPLKLINTGKTDQDVRSNLIKISSVMEEYIRKNPQDYMWFYKIWKYTDEATVTVLNDGKMGHYRQSEAIGAMTVKALRERGVRTKLNTVYIEFKSPTHAFLLSVIGPFMRRFVRKGRIGFILCWAMTPESFKNLTSMKSDVVVSCGIKLAGVNYYYAFDNDAKKIIAQKPGIWDMHIYDLIVLPRHDVKGKTLKGNIVTTFGALNPVNSDYLKEKEKDLLNRFSHLKTRAKKKIGMFIGGDSQHIFISEQQVRLIVNQFKGLLRDLNYELLLTSSRRTPAKLDQLLFREFKKHPSCPLYICPNKEDVPEAVGGILSLSDIVVVSGDSISMVSEAASSGKNVIVFLPEKRVQSVQFANKHLQFINSLHDYGHIISTEAQNVGQVIYEMIQGKRRTKKLDDSSIVYQAIEKVL